MIALFTPRRLRAGFVILLLVMGTALFANPGAGLAQDGTLEWSRPIPLSGALGGSRYPYLIADDNGQLLLIWNVTKDEESTIFVSRFDGCVWLRPVDVLLAGPRMQALLDGRNHVHLLHEQEENQVMTESEFLLADMAQGWGNDIVVNSAPEGTGADFMIDNDGTIYTVWMQAQTECAGCFSVGFKRYADDLSPDLTYRVLLDLTSSPDQRTQIARASDGTLYVVWDYVPGQGRHIGIALVLSTDNGDTWLNNPHAFAPPDADIRQPLFFLDKNDNLVLVYNYGVRDETYYSVSSDRGETWSDPAPIPGLFTNKSADASNYFAQVMDSAGVNHVIASGRASPGQQTPGLYHLSWDGSAWGDAQELYNEGDVPEFPSVSLGNGNQLYVAFSTRDQSPDSGDVLSSYRVWYTTALTNAPAATRVPLPTLTPTPTPTSTPEPTGTATPRPSATPVPIDAQTGPSPADAGSILLIVIVAVPVALILIGVILWASLFRRRT